jgi:cytochrome P450
VLFHPLRKFPGPKLAGASGLYLGYYGLRGQTHTIVEKLHDKYGDVVRTTPNELSFINEAAWKDIYSYRAKDRSQMQKQRAPLKGPYHVIIAPDDVHARQRKILSASFSERAVSWHLRNWLNSMTDPTSCETKSLFS